MRTFIKLNSQNISDNLPLLQILMYDRKCACIHLEFKPSLFRLFLDGSIQQIQVGPDTFDRIIWKTAKHVGA